MTKAIFEVNEISTPVPLHLVPDKRRVKFGQKFQGQTLDQAVKIFYDVERPRLDGGDIMIQNGYFIHFMSPKNLPPLEKGWQNNLFFIPKFQNTKPVFRGCFHDR